MGAQKEEDPTLHDVPGHVWKVVFGESFWIRKLLLLSLAENSSSLASIAVQQHPYKSIQIGVGLEPNDVRCQEQHTIGDEERVCAICANFPWLVWNLQHTVIFLEGFDNTHQHILTMRIVHEGESLQRLSSFQDQEALWSWSCSN